MENQALQPAAPPQDPRIGMVLQERYRIVRKLGDGGMGAVYEGEHVLIKRRVAIKVLHAQFAQNPEIVARFQREAEAATSIGHPNIIEVTDMGRFPDGTAYMVLEFLEGRDWSHDIEGAGPQPLGKVVHILTQVCDALAAAHAKGIVHRDLKPENIFLIERRGDPDFAKVLDFGISKIADAQGQDRSLTQTGTALGTPYYMAPEQCQGKRDIDHRADIYSLGVILFQALTAQYPFDDESYPMLVLKICTEPPPALAHYRPDVPAELQQIVNRMLAKDRDHRYQSVEEVRAALAPFAGLNDAPVVATNAPSTSSRGPSVLSGGAMTPTGTAYLPNTPPPGALGATGTPYPAEERKKSGMGALLAVLLLVGMLTVAGIGVGTWLALQDDPSDGTAASTEPREGGEVGSPPPADEPSEPAAVEDEAPPVQGERNVADVSAGEETVQLTINVSGPDRSTIYIDGYQVANNAFDGQVERDAPAAPGEEQTLHDIEVRADGWQTERRQMSFRMLTNNLNIEMEREQTAAARPHSRRGRTPAPPSTVPPPSTPLGGTTSGGTAHGGSTQERTPEPVQREEQEERRRPIPGPDVFGPRNPEPPPRRDRILSPF